MSDPNTPDGLNPEQPAAPGQPTVPEQPAQPQQPAAPEQPTQEFPSAEQFPPAPPTQPTQPIQPQQPAMTVQPPQAPGGYQAPGQPPVPPVAPGGYPGYQGVPQPTQTKGLAISALIVGIASLVFCWIPVIGILGGIAAVVLGIIAIKKAQSKGMSITGIITGALAILSATAILIFTVMFITAVSDTVSEQSDSSSQQTEQPTEDAPSATEDSTDDSGTESTTDGDRSPEFCAALDEVMAASTSATSATEISADLLAAYKKLAETSSPNQAAYQKMYDFMSDPVSAATDPNFESATSDFTSAMFDDAMACL